MSLPLHRFALRRRVAGPGPLTGMNTVLEMDGQELRGVQSVALTVDAGGIARVTLYMLAAEVAVDDEMEVDARPPLVQP